MFNKKFPRHCINRTISTLFLSLIFFSLPATALADQLDELVNQWRTSDYSGVLPRLIDYRLGPYGKNVQVDYMIATSLCRLPGNEELGRKYFQRIISAYELTKENRQQIENEYDLCLASSPQTATPVLVSFNIGRSDVGVRGKTFYWLDQQNGPLGGDPIKTLRDIEPAELQSRLFLAENRNDAIQKIQAITGNAFRVEASGHFIMASSSGHSVDELQKIGRYLDMVANFFHDEFNMPLPEYLVTIYLCPTTWDLQRMAERIHGLGISEGSIGYSFRDDYSISGVVQGIHAGTLKHELFHLMVRSNFGDIPPWMDEGFASLYEVSRREGQRISGLQNWREDILKRFWSQRPQLADLIQMDWEHFDAAGQSREQQAVNHAMARYFALYLQEEGKLAAVYKAFQQQKVEDLSGDPSRDSLNILQAVLNQPLSETDNEFVQWFNTLKRPLTPETVKTLQIMLNSLGYEAGEADGLMGSTTKQALRNFQRAEGLTTTGQADITTMEVLRARAAN